MSLTSSVVSPEIRVTTLNDTRRDGGVAFRVLHQAAANSNQTLSI
jgi:hypothetical protein